jgi:DNA-binding NarL/FixJ family response regulator
MRAPPKDGEYAYIRLLQVKMKRVRVLLADDHPTVLARVSGILGDDFEIVGAVNNGRDAVVETLRLDPDVLVIDIAMPISNGLEAAGQLQAAKVRTKVVFLTVHNDRDFVDAALSAGASGYVTKADVATDLAAAINEALQGQIHISKSVMA